MSKQKKDQDEESSEGELKFYDKDGYIVSGDELFKFEQRRDIDMNWRSIREFDNEFQERLNLIQSYDKNDTAFREANDIDPSSHILQNLDQLAYTNLDRYMQDPMPPMNYQGKWVSKQGHKTIKIMQYTMQYYMFAQKHMINKVLTLSDYLEQQNQELEKLKNRNHEQKVKIKKERYKSEQLNEQALHYELIVQKLRPDILEKRMQATKKNGDRKDLRLLENDVNVEKDILVEQGILKPGQGTVIYDKVVNREQIERERRAKTQVLQTEKMDQILDQLKNMKGQINQVQKMNEEAKLDRQKVQVQTQVIYREKSPVDSRSGGRTSTPKKYQSPSRDDYNLVKKDENQAPEPAFNMEESIQSDIPQVYKPPSSYNLEPAESSQANKILEDSIGTSSGKYHMKRVKGKNIDHSGSNISASTSMNKQKKIVKHIEIEREEQNEDSDDNYSNDQFDETYQSQSMRSEDTKVLQPTPSTTPSITSNRSVIQNKKRPTSLLRNSQTKDTAPIAEEALEDEMSDNEDQNKGLAANKVNQRLSERGRAPSTMRSKAQSSVNSMERDSKQDDLEKEMYMEEIGEAENSQSNAHTGGHSSVPIEDPSSQSGSYLPAFVERAQNIENKTADLNQSKPKEPNSGSIVNREPKIAVLSPTMSDSQPNPPKIKDFGMQPDEDDYSLDFDNADISTSNMNIKPPQPKPFSNQASNHQSKSSLHNKGMDKLHNQFNINFDDSTPSLDLGGQSLVDRSIDFQISASRADFAAYGLGESGGMNRSRKLTGVGSNKQLDDESMNSQDFAFSQSNIQSQSGFEFGQSATTNAPKITRNRERSGTEQQPKKELYGFGADKFTSFAPGEQLDDYEDVMEDETKTKKRNHYQL